MELLNNPWVTGIGGGIISSLIVFFVTRYFLRRGANKEYLQKIETANNEILYSVRPLIIDKKIPSKEVFDAIKLATAKRYGVKHEDLYNEFSLSNDLVNEIMSNSFLSSEQKVEFCDILQSLKNINIKNSGEKEVEIIYMREKSNLSKYNSILMALTSFSMFLSMTLFINDKDIFNNFSILLYATLIPIGTLFFLTLTRVLKDKRKVSEIAKDRNKEEVSIKKVE